MSGDAAALWPRVAEGLRRDLGARTFDHWLKPVRFADYCTLSGVLTLETASRFSANWINERFGDRLELAWRHHLPSVRSVLVRAGNATGARGAVMAAPPPLPTFEPPAPPAATSPLTANLCFRPLPLPPPNIPAATPPRPPPPPA